MINISLFFKDNVRFSSGYERVVHGARGPYIELKIEQILHTLYSPFGTLPNKINEDEPFYYYYLKPIGRSEKIYWQIKKVKYADYKIGYYYISPDLLLPFEERDPKINPLF